MTTGKPHTDDGAIDGRLGNSERVAIVRWLKAQAARCLKNKRDLREMLSPAEWDKLTTSEMAYRFAAKALNRGDHLKEPKP